MFVFNISWFKFNIEQISNSFYYRTILINIKSYHFIRNITNITQLKYIRFIIRKWLKLFL